MDEYKQMEKILRDVRDRSFIGGVENGKSLGKVLREKLEAEVKLLKEDKSYLQHQNAEVHAMRDNVGRSLIKAKEENQRLKEELKELRLDRIKDGLSFSEKVHMLMNPKEETE